MQFLKGIVLTLIGLVVVLLVVGLFLPSEFNTARSVVIDAPAEVVFDHVNTMRKHEAWSPWKLGDPTLVMTYNGPESGVGAAYSWTSKNSSSGTYTITESVPPRRVAYDMVFQGDIEADGQWLIEPAGEGVEVTWSFHGDVGNNPLGRFIGLMIDKMVGRAFARGLQNLKEVAETAPAPAGGGRTAPEPGDDAMDPTLADDSSLR